MASDSEPSASAQNGGRKSEGNQGKNDPKQMEGQGNKRRQSQSGRDVGGAKHGDGSTWSERHHRNMLAPSYHFGPPLHRPLAKMPV
ncbi:hypothetical protein TNIN_497021 [Trichonephila inaurata madagascariensis]|uniref:Uncharacterized protein n=1 Tax=Trichonephila inaurata madagascariensis TaxID=2747483 RepID=A0A8X6X0P4_9ARAC|nr:hypothetical protein TNIN_497021 [Trichonephila inaurata madagascariensis]